MKKSFLLILLSFALLVSLLPVSAAETDTVLKVNYTVSDNGNYIVTASLCDIKPQNGIVVIDYRINIDSEVFELVSAKPNVPDKWKNNDGYESLSREQNYGYKWAQVMIAYGFGIKENDQLSVTLELKRLKDVESKIEFIANSIATETFYTASDGSTMTDLLNVSGTDYSLVLGNGASVSPAESESPDVSQPESQPESAPESTSYEQSDEIPPFESVESSEPNESVTPPESSESNTEIGSSESSVVTQMPSLKPPVPVPVEQENSSSVWYWIGGGAVAVVVAALVVFLVKKGKKS